MTAIFPASLPDFVLVDGYGETPRMAKASFQSDTGPAIERRRGTMRLSEMSVRTIMTYEQVATFEDFIEVELSGATLPFMFLHPRKQAQVKVKIEGDQPYQITPYSPEHWSIAMTLLVIG